MVRTFKSGKTRSGYSYYEILARDLPTGRISGSHIIHVCPWCGSEKLYFNFKKGIGLCFHCETVAIDKDHSKPVSLVDFSWINFLSLSSLKDISWTTNALLSFDAKVYLSKRKCCYDNSTIQRFNLRTFAGVSGEKVLLLPNNHPFRLKVDSFQTTIIAGNSYGPKYVTYSDNKVIYYLNKCNVKSIALVEGVFDAIAVTTFSQHQVVACPLLGKSLSKSQERQLYRYLKGNSLKEVFVILDGDVKRSRKIQTCHQIMSINSSIRTYYVDLPGELDPEESVAENVFDKSFQNAKRVIA